MKVAQEMPPTREELLEVATSDDAKRAVKAIIKTH